MNRIFLTFQLYLSIICLGLSGSVLGPTLIALGTQIGIYNVGSLSFLFVLRAAMYLIGSTISGYVATKYDCGFHIVTGTMFYAAGILVMVPYITNAYVMYLAITLHGLANGVLTNLPNTLILRIHETSPNQGMYMQGLHAMFGVGATAAPMFVRLLIPTNIMRVFLVITLFHVLTGSVMIYTILSNTFESSDNDVDNGGEESVKMLLPSSSKQHDKHISERATFGRRELTFIVLMSLFIMCYVGQEVGVGALLYSFGRLSAFDMSPSDAANLTTSFWASFTIGRFFAIFQSKYLKSITMLRFAILGVFLGTVLLQESVSHIDHEDNDVALRARYLLWIAVSMLGFTNAPIYASAVTLTDEYVKTNGNVVSALVAGDTLGEMIIPGMIGQLMSHFGPESFSLGIAIPVACSSALFLFISMCFSPRSRIPAYSL